MRSSPYQDILESLRIPYPPRPPSISVHLHCYLKTSLIPFKMLPLLHAQATAVEGYPTPGRGTPVLVSRCTVCRSAEGELTADGRGSRGARDRDWEISAEEAFLVGSGCVDTEKSSIFYPPSLFGLVRRSAKHVGESASIRVHLRFLPSQRAMGYGHGPRCVHPSSSRHCRLRHLSYVALAK